ncbi:MAG: antibiotic biosynthesis monooxygenase [Chloroflexota bacterium]
MEIVLIDTFIVPEESRAEFRQAATGAQSFIRTLPGYVEGYIYEQMNGDSSSNFLTTAVWKTEDDFENAKKAVLAEYQRTGYDPQVTRRKLGIEQTRSTYTRAAY